ncbi:hypothetical protein ACUXMI_001546 [Cupriavidus metallidurans]
MTTRMIGVITLRPCPFSAGAPDAGHGSFGLCLDLLTVRVNAHVKHVKEAHVQ